MRKYAIVLVDIALGSETAREELVNEFAEKVVGLESPVSAAQIQGFFMFSKDNPQDIIDNVNELKPQEFKVDSCV